MILLPVSPCSRAHVQALYDLLSERPREHWVSHNGLTTLDQHAAFVASHPFRYWYLLGVGGVVVGSLECTERNEIGVHILASHQRKGYALQALDQFFRMHEPLPAIPAVRNSRWLANIAVGNPASKAFFTKAGFRPLQETWAIC